jgi:small GTP-binding protein
MHDRFRSDEPNTVGALYETFTQEHDGRQVEVQVWDTAGQEQYRSLGPVYFRSAAGALIVFDLTLRASYENVANWLNCFRSASSDKSLVFLVGNKTDLASERKISAEEAKQWAHENHCEYFETSAQNGNGVHELFTDVAKVLVSQSAERVPDEPLAKPSREDRESENVCC